MKTAHIADLHHCPERHKKVMFVMDALKETAADVDLLTCSGENFHNPYNIQDVYDEFLDKYEEITVIKPVATIDGTRGKHEKKGMVKTLSRAGVVYMVPGLRYFLNDGKIITGDISAVDHDPKLLLFPVPHPHKANMHKKGMSSEESNAVLNRRMVDLYKMYGALRAENPDVPALAVGHGVVKGKSTRDIKALSDSAIFSSEAEIALMGCDFNWWGHYHNPVEFETIPGGYLGSFAWDFNECDYKPAITIVDWDTREVTRRELDINMKRKLVMFPGDELPDLTGCDVHIVNNKTEFTAEDAKEAGAGLVKVTAEIEIESRVRSSKVVEAESYPDKFKAVYPKATERQLEVSNQFWLDDVANGKIPQRKHIVPLWVEIFGNKAFLERLGVDHVRVDLRELDPGITMLIGPGGYGKSTLMDLFSPFSVMFLQGNSMISTFELGGSVVRQGYMINDKEYLIEKHFKPNLKFPKSEYFAFEIVDGGQVPIPGVIGKKDYDKWSVSMFGSPRKYATSVLNTQFSDNKSDFMGQPINPSLVQATNIELKALFHELAATDLKHLEMKCKKEADFHKEKADREQIKRDGVEEGIPETESIELNISAKESSLTESSKSLKEKESQAAELQKKVDQISKDEAFNQGIDASVNVLKDQLQEERGKKTALDLELSEVGNTDIETVNRLLSKMEIDKSQYDTRMAALPEIQQKNSETKKAHDLKMTNYNKEFGEVTTFNSDIDVKISEVNAAKEKVKSLNSEKERYTQRALTDTVKKNQENREDHDRKKTTLSGEITTLETRVKDGEEAVKNIKKCPECGYVDNEAMADKEKYLRNIEKFKVSIKEKKDALVVMVPPAPVVIEADLSQVEKDLEESEKKIVEVPKKKDPPIMPIPVPLDDETIPSFDTAKYESLKEKSEGYSEESVTELRKNITAAGTRIEELSEKIRTEEAKRVTIDRTAEVEIISVELAIGLLKDRINTLKSDIAVLKSKLEDIKKRRESLVEYDTRIEESRKEEGFWADMKEKWGPSGIPARILEHTGPYVSALANEMLAKYYPIYKVHSETVKMSSDGKKELEVFNINVINQERGTSKPLNCISGEERNFVLLALRHAFRVVNEQNTLETWGVIFEDESDAHVSTGELHSFWDMIEDTLRGRVALCISHTPEVKSRSGSAIDIKEIEYKGDDS